MSCAINLADLIAPIAIETFFATYWETSSLYLERNNPTYYDPVLQIDDLDHYLSVQQLSPTFVRVTKRDTPLSIEDWTKGKSLNEGNTERAVDPVKLFGLYADGGTIVINGAHKAIPPLTTFCAQLEKELKFRVQTNLYITPPGAQGFPAHYDLHDVMVLQISGSKTWQLYGTAAQPLPVEKTQEQRGPYPVEKVTETIQLQAGDLLYLPRGFVHDARTTEESSIHITLGLLPRYWYHLIEEMAQIAKKQPTFRQALPHGFTTEQEKAQFIVEFETYFHALLDRVDISTLLARADAAFVADQIQPYRGHLHNLLQVPALSAQSVLSKELTVEYLVAERGEEIAISFGEHEITIPTYLKSTLAVLLQEHPFAIHEIQGLLTEQGKIDLITQFVQAGLLRIDRV